MSSGAGSATIRNVAILDALRIPEFQFGDFLMPWGMVVSAAGFVAAWLAVVGLESCGLTRRVWHLPLFFVSLAVLFGCTLGLVLAP